MERRTLDDHLEVVRESLVMLEDWDVLDVDDLRAAVRVVRSNLRVQEAWLDGGSAERRRKDRQRTRKAQGDMPGSAYLFEV